MSTIALRTSLFALCLTAACAGGGSKTLFDESAQQQRPATPASTPSSTPVSPASTSRFLLGETQAAPEQKSSSATATHACPCGETDVEDDEADDEHEHGDKIGDEVDDDHEDGDQVDNEVDDDADSADQVDSQAGADHQDGDQVDDGADDDHEGDQADDDGGDEDDAPAVCSCAPPVTPAMSSAPKIQ